VARENLTQNPLFRPKKRAKTTFFARKLKKVAKKFGEYRKSPYLCTRFSGKSRIGLDTELLRVHVFSAKPKQAEEIIDRLEQGFHLKTGKK